ncbi:MAG: hypothetical protein QT05_C0020G0007, partial [archaeon GW2011_AR13]
KKKPEISTTIEAFMGDMVHQSLEDLYKRKKFQQRIAKASLIKFFRNLWAKNYSSDILIVKEDQGLTENNYRKMGEKFLLDYFERMKPFEEFTILGLETQDRMTLPDGNQWHVRIDKLGCDNDGNYFVCDYKTNARMKDQEEADQDRQLAMYSIWVKDKFKDAKSVKLVWHMLAFDKDAISERTDEQLEKLQNEIVEKIKEIENAKEFPGVKLVDEFAETKKNLSELNKKEDELKEKLIVYAKQFGIDIVYGSNMKTSVKEIEKVVLPEDKKELINFLKENGMWDEISMINFMGFQSRILKGQLDEVKDKVEIVKDFRLSLSKRKDTGDE